LGSSKYWDKATNGTGILNGYPYFNPDFYDWNAVHLIYCDGASFSGNMKDPVKVDNELIYYRGKFNLDAAIAHLKEKQNFNSATHVILTGCSAGGLSTFLHADYLADAMPKGAVYKVAPQSGFFLPLSNLEKKGVYISQMKNVFEMQNASINVNQECLKDPKMDKWKCIFSPYTYNHIKTPIFVLDSTYDSWSMYNILGAGVTSFQNCAGNGPVKCNSTEIGWANAWRTIFLAMMKVEGSNTFYNPKNGVFITSCWTHCASFDDNFWSKFMIEGKVLNKAFSNWFFEKTKDNNLIDCQLTTRPPYRCNQGCSPH